jgi:tight adherence protein B
MAIIAYKNYKKECLKRRLRRQLVNNKKEMSLKELLNLKFDKLEKLFIQAGIDTVYVEDVFLAIVLIFVISIGISLIFNMGVFAILIPIVLIGIGLGYIKAKAQKRINTINKQFCDSLDDIGDDLRINRNLYIAIKNSLPSMGSPLKEEFELVCKNVESNIDIIDALQMFADRIGNSIIQSWVDAIIFASEKKSNVADVCKKYNKKIKQRLRAGENVKAKLQGIKFTVVLILFILIGMIILFYSTTPEFIGFLSTGKGKLVTIYATISITVTTIYIFNKIDKEVADI